MKSSAAGQISLRKADIAMNSIYSKVLKTQEEKDQLDEKLQGYLNMECSIPLPKYSDGGVFNSYIQTDNFQKSQD